MDCRRRLWPWQRKRITHGPFVVVTMHAWCLRDPKVTYELDDDTFRIKVDWA